MIASLRKSQHGDFDKLLAMYGEFEPKQDCQGLPPATREQTVQWLQRVENISSTQFVIVVGRSIVGHAMLCPSPHPREAELAVFVLPDFRGVGLGKALTLGALNCACRELELSRIWVSIRGSNSAALRLFEDLGFHPLNEWDPLTWELQMERLCHCATCKQDACLIFPALLPSTVQLPSNHKLAV